MDKVYRDIVVSTEDTYSGKKNICMNIFVPDTANNPAATLVYCHGGAYLTGDYTQENNLSNAWYTVRDTYKELGVALVCVGYRLADEACFPAQIHDLKGCIRYLRANGDKYGLSTEKIGIAGESAGGHLSALLALSSGEKELEGNVGGNLEYSSSVQFCADFYGVVDFLSLNDQFDSRITRRMNTPEQEKLARLGCKDESPEYLLFGLDKTNLKLEDIIKEKESGQCSNPVIMEKVHLFEIFNLSNHLKGYIPPFFIGHGDADDLIPVQQNLYFYGDLCRAGTDVEFILTHDQAHGNNFHPYMKERYIRFVKKQLAQF